MLILIYSISVKKDSLDEMISSATCCDDNKFLERYVAISGSSISDGSLKDIICL